MKKANPINTTNAMGKKRKRPKNAHKGKKDDENILSKDLEDDNIRYMMDTKKNVKPREDLKSSFTLKNLTFKPRKYNGSYEDSFKQNPFSVWCILVQEKSVVYLWFKMIIS